MGVTVRQKRKGRGKPWYVYVHQNGQFAGRKVGTKQEALAVAAEIRRKLIGGQDAVPMKGSKAPTFQEYADHYMNEYAKRRCKVNTWRNYQTIIDIHLIPEWGPIPIDQIRRRDILELLQRKQTEARQAHRTTNVNKKHKGIAVLLPNQKRRPKKDEGSEEPKAETEQQPKKQRQPLSPATARNILALISGIFKRACVDELLTANPASMLGDAINNEDATQCRERIRALSREEAADFLRLTREHYPDYYAFIFTAFRTGMRQGELAGMAWSDLDFDACSITVKRTYTHGHWTNTKSKRVRVVDMSNQLRSVLLEHRDGLRLRFGGEPPVIRARDAKSGIAELIQPVFPCWEGGPLDADNFRSRIFGRLRKLAGRPDFRFHDIRHTFASLLLIQGEPMAYVKEQMGHASIQTTVDIYGKLVPGQNREAVNRLDDPEPPVTHARLVTAG